MKKLLLLTFLFTLTSSTLKADLGSCVVYHAKFYLKNGTIFNGCFEISGYGIDASLDEKDSNQFCHDKGVFELFKNKQKQVQSLEMSFQQKKDMGKVAVYKNIYYVQPYSMRKRADEELPKYGLVIPSDVIFVDSNEISKLVFWSAEYSKRYWLTSEMIVGTLGMLDTIRQQKHWNTLEIPSESLSSDTISFENYSGYDGGYVFYNYNSQINIAEMKRLIRLKFSLNEEKTLQSFKQKHKIKEGQAWSPALQWLYKKEYEQKKQDIKQWFWRKGILLLEVHGTC